MLHVALIFDWNSERGLIIILFHMCNYLLIIYRCSQLCWA